MVLFRLLFCGERYFASLKSSTDASAKLFWFLCCLCGVVKVFSTGMQADAMKLLSDSGKMQAAFVDRNILCPITNPHNHLNTFCKIIN